ncbi:segregation and condensation protein A [Thioalkalicoccus limnaeus]|uniref:Segregation and condensation protein A n=1 Tax=Thioalkalicoccus limnaeus TaxID=120681 RepID=A0ABV4BBK4_9GAMM
MAELTTEQQILIAMRQTLGAVIRDVTPAPGQRHPLSAGTIEDVRQCFALIAAREKELADQQGRGGERPYYADAKPTATVVPIAGLGGKRRSD